MWDEVIVWLGHVKAEAAIVLAVAAILVAIDANRASRRSAKAAAESAREATQARRESRLIAIAAAGHEVVSLTMTALDSIQRVWRYTVHSLVTQNFLELDDHHAASKARTDIGTIQTLARSVIEDPDLSSKSDDELVQIQEVAIVSGHTNWRTLRRYTHLKPESLVEKERRLRLLAA